jgi:hypothetical protein
VKGPGEERVKSVFTHFPFSLPPGALKCALSNNTNRIWKNEVVPKYITNFRIGFPIYLGMFSKPKNAVLKNKRNVT